MCRIARLFMIVIVPWCLQAGVFSSEREDVTPALASEVSQAAGTTIEGPWDKPGWTLTFHDNFEVDDVRVCPKD